MQQYLTENSLSVGFSELNQEEVAIFYINAIDLNGDHCYALLIDFELPNEVKLKTDDLPIIISQEQINIDQVSDFMKELIQVSGCNFNKYKSLIASLKSQEGYLISLNLLKLYIKLGLEYTKIHRVFTFKQEALFSDFIKTNFSLRKHAKSPFEKDMFKLIPNIICGELLYNAQKKTLTLNSLQIQNDLKNLIQVRV